VRTNREYPPLMRALCALPVYLGYGFTFDAADQGNKGLWEFGRDFFYSQSVSGQEILMLARVPNLLAGAALVALVGFWAFRLWGCWSGLLALFLAALEPTLIAHSSVVTTDVGMSFFMFLSLYLLWEYTARPSFWFLAGAGVSMGLALCSKHMAIVLPGIAGVILACDGVFRHAAPAAGSNQEGGGPSRVARLAAAAFDLFFIVILAGAVVTLVYGVSGISDWWEGFEVIREANRRGFPAFFRGQYSSEGFWNYYLVALMIKTPLATLLVIGASLVLSDAGKPMEWRDMAFLLLPVVVILVGTCNARINIGVRHVLPVYPFLFVCAGRLATVRMWRPWLTVPIFGLLLAWLAFSSIRQAPHHLAYFNELVGGSAEGYRYLSDSNVDWGQELPGLKAFLDREGVDMIYFAYYDTAPPGAFGIHYQYLPAWGPIGPPPKDKLPERPSRELLAIGAVNLQAVYLPNKNTYRWLFSRQPIAQLGYSLFVYDITNDADAHVRLLRVYLDANLPDLAAREVRRARALDPSNAEAKRFIYLLGAD